MQGNQVRQYCKTGGRNNSVGVWELIASIRHAVTSNDISLSWSVSTALHWRCSAYKQTNNTLACDGRGGGGGGGGGGYRGRLGGF